MGKLYIFMKMDSSAACHLLGMMMLLLSLYCMLCFTDAAAVAAAAAGHGSSPAMFVFGASRVDVGNNIYLNTTQRCDHPFYGIDFPAGEPTGRCSNGKIVPDLLADKLGVPSPKSYLSLLRSRRKPGKFMEGVNFASGSAGILSSTGQGLCISLDTQIDNYSLVFGNLVERMGIVWTKWFISNSIFFINIGSNDFLVYDGTGISKFVSLLISTLEGQLERICNLGARKFAFMGSDPVGCWPGLRAMNKITGDCNREINQASVLYNEQAALLLQKLQSKYADLSYSFFDSYRVFSQYINHPQTYGFDEVKAACCGMGFLRAEISCNSSTPCCSNRTKYVFWDGAHPTEAAAKLLVNTAFDGFPPTVFPINVRQLSGLHAETQINIAHASQLVYQ